MKRILKFGTAHCGMCKRVSDVFNKNGIEYEEIDCEENPALAEKYNIRNVPVVVVHDEENTRVYNNYGDIIKHLEDFK